ncbi:T9SS type A sorting domain-containing protein [Chryseobacterium sp.]|uniref:T9SS type A sorting domain-containing protein n=1 Tax=Chryseobacterium sp. TaxID=1871047 RepID=UPI00388D6AE6
METPPANGGNSVNFFFAQFDFLGNLKWSSYYGGSQYQLGQQYRSINIIAPDHSTFYLFGGTGAATGIASTGAWQPQLPADLGGRSTGFLARFSYKGELSTTEPLQLIDLVLLDNPNNGNFSLKGKKLGKEDTQLSISDASGRLIYKQNLPKQETVEIRLQDQLTPGVYFLQINGQKYKDVKNFKMIVKK